MGSDSLERYLGALLVESGASEDPPTMAITLSALSLTKGYTPFPLTSLKVELGVAGLFGGK